MKVIAPVLAALLLAACATPAFWTKSGASRGTLADDTERCYKEALSDAYPSASPRTDSSSTAPGLATPRTTPPPQLWTRAPRDIGFEHFDERLRYERCMAVQGYQATRSPRS
jgi:hypothetical protein